jgi:hypothetical protein
LAFFDARVALIFAKKVSRVKLRLVVFFGQLGKMLDFFMIALNQFCNKSKVDSFRVKFCITPFSLKI